MAHSLILLAHGRPHHLGHERVFGAKLERPHLDVGGVAAHEVGVHGACRDV